MLIDQKNANILSLGGEFVESLFNSCVVGLAVDDQEILLGIWRGCDMLRKRQDYICNGSSNALRRYLRVAVLSQSPASLVSRSSNMTGIDDTHLVTYHSKELPVLIGRSWGCHFEYRSNGCCCLEAHHLALSPLIDKVSASAHLTTTTSANHAMSVQQCRTTRACPPSTPTM